MNLDLTKQPFNLGPDDQAWAHDRLATMSLRQKIGQLFSIVSVGGTEQVEATIVELQPASIYRMEIASADDEQAFIARINEKLLVPILSATDLEGSFTTPAGADISPNPMALAAVNDTQLTQKAAEAMARQASDVGIKWSFTPCVDVNASFRSSIVGTRSFGSDVGLVRAQALATLKGFQNAGVAGTAKHFPGEGFDDRDQHLVTTANPLSVEDWRNTFGETFRTLIDNGVATVMPGHIGFPAYMRNIAGIDGVDAYRPASVNKVLLTQLLRNELGFEGLIISDASAMAGMTSWFANRADLVVACLDAGCDQILFSPDLLLDIETVEKAINDGRLSLTRIETSVLRTLALKASLGLHRPQETQTQTEKQETRLADQAVLQSAIERSVTLVKDSKNLLPLTPAKYPKVLVVSKGIILPFAPKPIPLPLVDMMRNAGFEVTLHEWGTPVDASRFDLLLYVFAEETLLTRGRINIDWLEMTGQFEAAMVRYWHTVPTAIISFGYPYYLYEAPMVHTYINAYASHPQVQAITLNALMGKTEFTGTSPVDPFGGIDPTQGARVI